MKIVNERNILIGFTLVVCLVQFLVCISVADSVFFSCAMFVVYLISTVLMYFIVFPALREQLLHLITQKEIELYPTRFRCAQFLFSTSVILTVYTLSNALL